MKYTGITYRPPFEASSLLLQVTAGCSHNRCSFCTMYRDVPFAVESMEQIEADLDEVRSYNSHVRRVFLENGDAFVLSADRLKTIAQLIHRKLPEVETIAMYASINNIRTKTDAELRQLRDLGINDLNIGLESGHDETLAAMNKGYTAAEAEHHLLRLYDAGIRYGANIILGGAGASLRREHALKSAEILNKTHPYLVFTGTIHPGPGSPMYEDLRSGTFRENTIEEYLEEEEIFLQALDLKDCYFFGLHPSNIVRMRGMLPRDKAEMLDIIGQMRHQLSQRLLKSTPTRYGEGAVYL